MRHCVEVYVESCRVAGIVPNTRAKKELLEHSCDLAHAALGRAGVGALGGVGCNLPESV